MESTGIEYPLKTKIRHNTQNVNAKDLQCQCIVSGRSRTFISFIYIRKYIFYIIMYFFSGPQFEKKLA